MKTQLGIIGIVNQELEQDRPATLGQLRAMGYAGIELGLDALRKEGTGWKKDLRAAGMEVITCHLGREALRGEDLEATLQTLKDCGAGHATVSWAEAESPEQIRRDAELYRQAGLRLWESGIRLCYHNHEHELSVRWNGQTALDLLMESVPPEALELNLDLAWATYAGADPVVWLRRYCGRVPILHVKDLYQLDQRGCFTAPGTGLVRIEECLRVAREGGCGWLVVEQDQPRRLQGLDLARAAALNLRELGWEVGQ